MNLSNEPMSRRRLLAIGGTVVGGAVAFAACGGDDSNASTTAGPSPTSGATPTTAAGSTTTAGGTTASSSTSSTVATSLSTGTPSTTVLTAADFADLGACQLLPELTQGPYPTLQQIERRDVTEGLPGLPLRVGIQVVDETCQPIEGAVVEIWHCDIAGDYSAYADGDTAEDAGEGTTFLRGFQTSNADGIVEFLTVYPGWYTGRAIHVHSKVHIEDTTVLTTQYLFDDELNAQIMGTEAYAAHGQPDTTNETDGVTQGDDDGLLFTVSDDADVSGKRALIVVGIDPAATSSEGGPGGGRGPGGAPPSGAMP